MDDILEKTARELLDVAIFMAVNAHYGNYDKGGMPYILHPITVMQTVNTTEEKVVAILHDVVEDTEIRLGSLYMFPTHIVDAVDAITKRQDEKYDDYLERVKNDKLALVVKLADIRHNTRKERLDMLPEKEAARLIKKYARALAILTEMTCPKNT